MSYRLSESGIVSVLARKISERLTRRVIADLQRMDTGQLSGDDSGLKNAWDEISVQVQQDHSIYWETYDEIVRNLAAQYVAELEPYEREALWLQTKEGLHWESKDEEDREHDPVVEDEIVNYVVEECVYGKAGEWTNKRIRNYIDGPLL